MKKVILPLVIVASTFSSCGKISNDISRSESSMNSSFATFKGSSDEYLMEKIPSYAGIYLGKDNIYYVALSDNAIKNQSLDQEENIKSLVNEAYHIESNLKSIGLSTQGISSNYIRFVDVKYSLKQLKGFQSKIESLYGTKYGISMSGLAVDRNKIYIYLKDANFSKIAQSAIEKLNIPSDAFSIVGSGQFDFSTSTSDYVRPIGAGLAISSPVGGCSIGPMVKRSTKTSVVFGFITARHCISSLNDNIYQGGYYLGKAFDQTAADSSNFVNADGALIVTNSANLRVLKYADIPYGYQSDAQYSGWKSYPSVPTTLSMYQYVNAYGKKGQIGGRIVVTGLSMGNPRFGVRNLYCYTIDQQSYENSFGESGGVVLSLGQVVGIVSGVTMGTQSDGEIFYFMCISSIQDVFNSMSESGNYTFYY